MKYTISLLSLIFLFVSCKSNLEKLNGLFSPEKLNSQFVIIPSDRDTTFVLQGGTRVFIPKDALQSKSQMVKLEFKEAITMQQIITEG